MPAAPRGSETCRSETSAEPSIVGDVDDHGEPTGTVGLHVVVRRVVVDVTVDQPLARPQRLPDHVVALTRTDVDGVGSEAFLFGELGAVAGNDRERAAVDVHGMDVDGVRADEPHPERLADP